MIKKNRYRNVYILESRNFYSSDDLGYCKELDLVLTYDFGLYHEIELKGGEVYFLDHMVHEKILHSHNFIAYDFFRNWHFDKDGQDIFVYEDVPFGFSLRLDLWDDILTYVRHIICLEQLTRIEFTKIYLGSYNGYIGGILKKLDLNFLSLDSNSKDNLPDYYFPSENWLNSRIRKLGLKQYSKLFFLKILYNISFLKRCIYKAKKKKIFIQEYYPTADIVQSLNKRKDIEIFLSNYSWKGGVFRYFRENVLSLPMSGLGYSDVAEDLLSDLQRKRYARLIVMGHDISNEIYAIVESRLKLRLGLIVKTLSFVVKFMDREKLDLVVLIANIGLVPTLINCVAKKRNIKSYMIINGLLSGDYNDEGKNATFINSYSEEIKSNYFKNARNVMCLGDPRMDYYSAVNSVKEIDRKNLRVLVGASGYSLMDMNTYLGVEFDFMYKVLDGLSKLRDRGLNFTVDVKLRSNSYVDTYNCFFKEYFDGLIGTIYVHENMSDVLQKNDVYISLVSQSLIEAACMGVAPVYFKNDTEVMDPPFDGSSTLTIARSSDQLCCVLSDFINGKDDLMSFCNREELSKYIGYIDGKNLGRNIKYIDELISNK